MSTVKSLKVTYNPINDTNTFTSGDWVSGQVTLEVAKDCQMDSLRIQFKGKAEVLWTERHGQTTHVYHSKDKYFSLKHYFVHDKDLIDTDNEILLTNQYGDPYSSVVAPGSHVYPFTFQIPNQEMPSSFTGGAGKIAYALKAKLSRSMRIPTTDSAKINFVSKVDASSFPGIMAPQHESKDKKLKFFSSGELSMDVDIEKTGFLQGEGLRVVAHIRNNSSRVIKPKFCLYSKHSFFAQGRRRLYTTDLLKEVGEPIPPSTSTSVTRVINIPHDAEPSIHNCSNIKAEHRLRVYLDVKYASDPTIKFSIIILPASQSLVPPPLASDFGPFGNTNPPGATWGLPPPQLPAASQAFEPPPPYASYGLYPPVADYDTKY